jgi:hypothetical protein
MKRDEAKELLKINEQYNSDLEKQNQKKFPTNSSLKKCTENKNFKKK